MSSITLTPEGAGYLLILLPWRLVSLGVFTGACHQAFRVSLPLGTSESVGSPGQMILTG